MVCTARGESSWGRERPAQLFPANLMVSMGRPLLNISVHCHALHSRDFPTLLEQEQDACRRVWSLALDPCERSLGQHHAHAM